MIVPTKVESVPSVAEPATTQKTLQAWARPWSATWLPTPVVSEAAVELMMKMNTPSGSFWASSVRVLVIPNVVSDDV